MRWIREDTGEFQLGCFWRNASIRWGEHHIFGICTFSHEVELLFAIESILGEQGGVGIVRMRVSFNWGSFGEILRLCGGVDRIFGICTLSHEVELLFAIESTLGEQGGVGIVRIRVSFNWGSFGEIRRMGGVYIAFLVYVHFHMKLNYFLPSSIYWASKVALES